MKHKPTTATKAAVLLAMTLAGSGHAATTPWASFGGFYAGMSKKDAKQAGYENCAKSGDSVFCDIPVNKSALNGLIIKSAKLEFKGPKHDLVTQMTVTVEGKQSEILSALKERYGQILDGGKQYVWQRETPHTIEIQKRQMLSTASISFRYDPSLSSAIQKKKDTAAKDQAVLKTF